MANESNKLAESSVFREMDGPRIRHITGVQIHQLTVHPNVERPKLLRVRSTSRSSLEQSTLANGSGRHHRGSSFGASNIIQEEDKPLSSSPDAHDSVSSKAKSTQKQAAPRLRTSSDASTSSSTFRTTRARASTLISPEIHTSAEEQRELGDFLKHQLARCFVALCAPSLCSPRAPFFLSPVHRPSTRPSFLGLDAQADFAPWLDVAGSAEEEVEVEVWVEVLDPGRAHPSWRRMREVGGRVAFKDLRLVDSQTPKLPDNTLMFTFDSYPSSIFYLPSSLKTQEPAVAEEASDAERKRRVALGRDIVRTAVERSVRETRMKKGAGVGTLHQFVNMQAVVADTKRGVYDVRMKVDALLLSPADRKSPKREVVERQARVRWLESQIAEVQRNMEEVKARMVLHRHALDERRAALVGATENEGLLRGQCDTLRMDIDDKIDDNKALQPAIHARRANLTQTLDALFPIEPLDPASLLYTILSVPLPIPTGPKDPAPPLTIPFNLLPTGVKVDEESTATALGFAAMVVSLLGTVTDRQVPYPVTCAGSRSVVKDLVSVMQGPRSFPLYAKGVEVYRYEYAVFLLNKNIEMLMLDCNIRMMDIRHTLPNLKTLLLTLSSPMPLPPFSQSLNTSRPNSRQGTRTLAAHSQVALGIGSSPLASKRPLVNSSQINLASVSDGQIDEKEAAAAVEDVSALGAA